MPEDRACRIRTLNDRFRRSHIGGRVLLTRAIYDLGAKTWVGIFNAVRRHQSFDADNDPGDLHDAGWLTHQGHDVHWKIDCYNRSLTAASPDPADPKVTERVLTIMLAAER